MYFLNPTPDQQVEELVIDLIKANLNPTGYLTYLLIVNTVLLRFKVVGALYRTRKELKEVLSEPII